MGTRDQRDTDFLCHLTRKTYTQFTDLGDTMKIERKFTKAGQDAYADIEFVTTSSEIRNPDGTVVFHLENVEVPKSWSQVASDVIAQKYFRKAGVPVALKAVREIGRASCRERV